MKLEHPPKQGCSAWDLILVTGGIACGNCGASSVPKHEGHSCAASATDGPCPLIAKDGDELCWIHRIVVDGGIKL